MPATGSGAAGVSRFHLYHRPPYGLDVPAGPGPPEQGHIRGQRAEAPVPGWCRAVRRRAGREGGLGHRTRVSPGRGWFLSCQRPCASQTTTGTTGTEGQRQHRRRGSRSSGEDGAAQPGPAPAGGPGPSPAGRGLTGEDGRPGPRFTHTRGSCSGGAPRLWNTPSTKTPFLPRQRR